MWGKNHRQLWLKTIDSSDSNKDREKYRYTSKYKSPIITIPTFCTNIPKLCLRHFSISFMSTRGSNLFKIWSILTLFFKFFLRCFEIVFTPGSVRFYVKICPILLPPPPLADFWKCLCGENGWFWAMIWGNGQKKVENHCITSS